MLPYLPDYLAFLSSGDSARNTLRDYRIKLHQFEDWLGERPYDQGSLLVFRDYCREDRAHAPATIRLAFCAIRAYTKWGKKTRRRAHRWPDPWGVELPRVPRHSSRVCPTDEQMTALFDAARRLPQHTDVARRHRGRILALLGIFAYAGLRRNECLRLEVRDIRKGAAWQVHVRHGKGRQIRDVDLSPQGQAVLTEWLAVRSAWCEDQDIRSEFLFPVDRRRLRLSDEGLDAAWAELLEVAGLSDSRLTPHCLRHWYGTNICAAEGIEVASEMLGHSSIATTERYLHVTSRRKKRAAQSLDQRLSSGSAPAPAVAIALPMRSYQGIGYSTWTAVGSTT